MVMPTAIATMVTRRIARITTATRVIATTAIAATTAAIRGVRRTAPTTYHRPAGGYAQGYNNGYSDGYRDGRYERSDYGSASYYDRVEEMAYDTSIYYGRRW